MSGFQLTVLGTRGSIPVTGSDKMLFGGATSCYMVQAGKQTVFLDGGSGLVDAPLAFDVPPVILLSHLHLDHVLGLGMYRRLSQKGCRTDLYVPESAGGNALDSLYAPPFWPLKLSGYAGDVRMHAFPSSLQIGDVLVETIPGDHPGGCLVMRLSFDGKTLVYATDQEPSETSFGTLAAFAKDADLLLFDGQFTEEEAQMRKGFGHSSPSKGIELMDACGAKQLLLIHHDPARTDAQLEEMEQKTGRGNVRFARTGETVLI